MATFPVLAGSGQITIKDGLVLAMPSVALTTGNLQFEDATPLSGNTTITTNTPLGNTYDISFTGVTIGPGITIQTGTYPTVNESALRIANFVNHGTILAQSPNTAVYFGGAAPSTPGTHWSNQGTITVSNGDVYLGGTFSPSDLGNFNRTGGTIYVRAYIQNAGQTLAFDNSTGPWIFDDLTTIDGGNITATIGNEPAIRTDASVTFSNVSLASNLTLQESSNLSYGNRQSHAWQCHYFSARIYRHHRQHAGLHNLPDKNLGPNHGQRRYPL